MTDISLEKDRCKFLFPKGNGLLKTPMRIENQQHEKGMEITAIWDTGAQFSVMTRQLAEAMEIATRPAGVMDGVSQSMVVELGCAIAFPGNLDWYTYAHPRVVERIAIGVDFIIGMDIISMGDLSLRHTAEGTLMEFVFNEDYFIRKGGDDRKAWHAYQTIYNLIMKFERDAVGLKDNS